MSDVLGRLEALRATDDDLTLTALGGLDEILADREQLLASPDMPLLVGMLLEEWPTLAKPEQAAALIVDSIPVQDAFALEDIVDDALSCPSALPLLAEPLTKVLRRRAGGADAEAGIALEGLTRLTLGGWIRSSLWLRSELVGRADELAEASDSQDLDPVLIQRIIRALGAAGERWDDEEVAPALLRLLALEDHEDDVAFELAMLHLRAGLTQETVEAALPELNQARDWLQRCSRYEDRLDARIFHAALEALLAFAAGDAVPDQAVQDLHTLVLDYRLMSLHERPTWRQPRADATAAWVQLIDRLHALHDLDTTWWDPPALISAVAQAYGAHRTMHLLVPPDLPYADGQEPPSGKTAALPQLIQPRLTNSLTAKADSVEFLDRWLSLHADDTNADSDTHVAVRELRTLLRAGGDDGRPKVPEIELGAVASALALPTAVRDRLAELVQQEPTLAEDLNRSGRDVLATREADLSDYFNTELKKWRTEIARITDISGEAALRVENLLVFLMRFAKWAIEVERGGAVGEPYLRPFTKEEDAPLEVDMAKDLAKRLYTSSCTSPRWEVKNVGGGRTDIILFYGAFYLVIECKRELDNASPEYLSTRYSIQPGEYGATDVPVGFLVVLELTPKTRNAQLHQCIWVTEVPPAEPGGRPHAVIVVRIQGNTRSPSYSSTPADYRRRAGRNSV